MMSASQTTMRVSTKMVARPIHSARMHRRTRSARLGLAAIAAGLVALAAPALQAQHAHGSPPRPNDSVQAPKLEDVPKLTVRGRAELEKPADRALLSIGVVTEANEAADAMQENNRTMDDIVKAIRRAGLEEREYETGQFRVRPQYSRRPRRPDQNWEPQIVGYEVTNELQIRTKKIELVGELLQEANKAGANTVEVTGFDLSDPRQHRSEAIREATQNAMADAQALAEAADLELVRIIAVTLDQSGQPQPILRTMSARGAEMDRAAAPPIKAGDVTIDASVTMVYEIRAKQSGGGDAER